MITYHLNNYCYVPEEAGHAYASCEVIAYMYLYVLYACFSPYTFVRQSHLGSCSRSQAGSRSIKHFRGLGCLLQSSKHCSPTADTFLWDILQILLSMTCGNDWFFFILNALMHRNQGGALVCDGTNLKH